MFSGVTAMTKMRLLGLGTMLVALVGLTVGTADALEDKGQDHHGGPFMTCAKACSACQLECASCFDHCVREVAAGKKEHAATARTCADCDKCCALAVSLCASNSPMATHICEGCAKCCDDCATACEKFADDKHMAACAKVCRDCAKSCREMVKHGKHKN